MTSRLLAGLALSTLMGLPAGLRAQDHGDHDGKAGMGEMDAAMEEWMKYMMPGAPHEEFGFYEGDWTFVNHINMGGQETTSEGTSHAEVMMDGRYLHASHVSEMMGMPFQGVGITGYDNLKKEYFNIWFDNMGTGMMVSTGQKDKNGNVELKGSAPDPAMGNVDYRMVTTITGKDTYTYEMYASAPEGEQRAMQILYTRVKR